MAITNANKKVMAMVQDNGELPTYAWPGGYPLFYVDAIMTVLCPFCANGNNEFSEKLVDYDCNWEDSELFCDNCNERIESAYGDDNDSDSESSSGDNCVRCGNPIDHSEPHTYCSDCSD
jgi:hypothetical protein